MTVAAQNNALQLEGSVIDFKTRNDVVGATVELLNMDSSVVCQRIAKSENSYENRTFYSSDFTLEAPRTSDATYIVKVSMLGYKTLYKNFSVGKVSKSTEYKQLPELLLHEDSKLLNEVVVSSTKVKFYHRGDTVVYNADAFVLSEGSMLESLVRQMPGMEIKSNGDIYHNGRLVEELLLNGKAMFSKDKRVLMENLPTYTVKQVEVYDRQTDKAKFLGDDSPMGKRYAMDVKLKKEYSIGWMANVEAGGGFAKSGHDTPYIGRLFAMRFSDHSRLAVYANANNLNDSRKPGENDAWKPSDMKEGTLTEQLAGIDYNIDSRNKKWNISGEAKFSHSILNNEQTQNRNNFFQSGDTYERAVNTERNKNLSLSTNQRLSLTLKNTRINISPALSYSKYDFTSGSQSTAWADTTINRYQKAGLQRGHDKKADLSLYVMQKIFETSNYIDFYASMSYKNRHDETFNRYTLWYGNATQPQANADQYYKNHPDHTLSTDAFVTYSKLQLADGLTLNLRYAFNYTTTTRHSYLYLLDQMDSYEQGELGALPSAAEYAANIDKRNSYESRTHETNNIVIPILVWQHKSGNASWDGQLQMPVMLKTRSLEYRRGAIDTTMNHTNLLLGSFNGGAGLASVQYKDKTQRHEIEYRITPTAPDLLYMVDMHDDTDPLNIREGSSGLRPSYEHTTKYRYQNWRNWQTIEYGAELRYSLVDNAIGMGYLYDKLTGVKTYKAYNVDGNWATQGSVFATLRNKKQTLILQTTITGGHRQSADYAGQETVTQKNTVRTENISQNIKLTYAKANQSVSLNAAINYRYLHSPRTDFETQNACDFHYGLSAVLNLPWNVQLSTDITMYSRRGYSESTLNTDDLVWNARLSKSLMKGHLVMMIDGFDMLGNLSSVSYNLNAQGRTEIRRNVLPQYAMLHVQYKLNIKPKKKN